MSDTRTIVPGRGHSTSAPPAARTFYRHSDGSVRRDLTAQQIETIVQAGEGVLWVDVDLRDRHQFEILEKVFRFHPLALEDVLNPSTRVKLEEYESYLFGIVRGVRWCEDTPDDPYDVDTYNVYFFLGRNYLVTAHAEWSPSVEAVLDRIQRAPDSLDRGAGRLMHAVMDATIDEFFPIIDQIDLFVDGLEERVFSNFDQAALRDIFSVKRLVLSLRRHLAPQREVFNILTNRPSALLTQESQLYFRDVYDHVLRINDSLDTYRDLLSSTLDSYLTQVSNRLGTITKALSVVATISLPFVVVSGMWGMNFDAVPLSHHVHGFWLMLILQLGLAGLLLAYLRWRELL